MHDTKQKTLTNKQKAALATMLIQKAGSLIEFWGEYADDELQQVSAQQAAEQFAVWLKGLPGNSWDSRLPNI